MNDHLTAAPETAPETEATCGSCPHPLDAHDPIGLRFCKATAASGRERACVCSSEAGLRGLAYDTSNLSR